MGQRRWERGVGTYRLAVVELVENLEGDRRLRALALLEFGAVGKGECAELDGVSVCVAFAAALPEFWTWGGRRGAAGGKTSRRRDIPGSARSCRRQ